MQTNTPKTLEDLIPKNFNGKHTALINRTASEDKQIFYNAYLHVSQLLLYNECWCRENGFDYFNITKTDFQKVLYAYIKNKKQ